MLRAINIDSWIYLCRESLRDDLTLMYDDAPGYVAESAYNDLMDRSIKVLEASSLLTGSQSYRSLLELDEGLY
jgi:hypothetical protein